MVTRMRLSLILWTKTKEPESRDGITNETTRRIGRAMTVIFAIFMLTVSTMQKLIGPLAVACKHFSRRFATTSMQTAGAWKPYSALARQNCLEDVNERHEMGLRDCCMIAITQSENFAKTS